MPPSLSQIQNTFFLNVINRLGIRPPPPDAFLLSNIVQPVSIVDTDISIPAVLTTIPLGTPFTQGELAPVVAANTVLADTLAQPAGTFNVLAIVSADSGAAFGLDFRLQRRDAANAANIWSQQFSLSQVGTQFWILPMTIVLSVNERVRLITKAAGSATANIQGSLWLQQVL
jgi:hypothetical protein